MNSKLKKIVLSVVLAVFSFLAILPNTGRGALAQDIQEGTWFNPGFINFVIKVWDADETEIFGERYTYAQTHWIISSIVSFFLPDNIEQCAVAIATDENFYILGAQIDIDAIVPCAQMVANPFGLDTKTYPDSQPYASVMYQEMAANPLSGLGYLAEKGSDLNLVEEVHAQQGFGFQQLDPIKELWQASRDVSYFLLILVAIVMAFMIMFRTKTSPQTVVTIQSAIPKLVIALILITFSYAIAGFMVDLAYLVIGLFAILLKLPGIDIIESGMGASDLFTQLVSGSPLMALYWALFLYSLMILIIGSAGAIASVALSLGIAAPLILVTGGLSALFMLIFAIVLIIVYIRIVWMLLKSFIQIVLLIVAGPFYILIGTLPGPGGVGAWLRSLAAQIAVFPTVAIMMFFAHFFFWRIRNLDILGDLFIQFDFLNPYQLQTTDVSGYLAMPGFNLSPGTLGFLGAFAILFLAPHAANIIKSLIERQPFGVGSAIGQSVGPVTTLGRAGGTFGTAGGLEFLEKTGRAGWFTQGVRRLTGIKK